MGTIHLDALPGKQIAIDADLGAGMFTDELARWRREQIERETELVSPVLLCASPARFHLSRVLEPFLPKWDVLSPAEIPHLIPI